MIKHSNAKVAWRTLRESITSSIKEHLANKGTALVEVNNEEQTINGYRGLYLSDAAQFDLEGGNEETVKAMFIKDGKLWIRTEVQGDGAQEYAIEGRERFELHPSDYLELLLIIQIL